MEKPTHDESPPVDGQETLQPNESSRYSVSRLYPWLAMVFGAVALALSCSPVVPRGKLSLHTEEGTYENRSGVARYSTVLHDGRHLVMDERETPPSSVSQAPSTSESPSNSPTRSDSPTESYSPSVSSSPSDKPTNFPTQSISPSQSNSPSISSQPSVTTVLKTKCPSKNDIDEVIPKTIIHLTVSKSSNLCMLLLLKDNGSRVPVARSYSGKQWEAYAGLFSSLSIACNGGRKCDITLDEPPNDATYVLRSTAPSHALTTEDKVARFLESATFGGSPAEIDSLMKMIASYGTGKDEANIDRAFASWIMRQQDPTMASPTSHRAFFRQRTLSWAVGTSSISLITEPCNIGSRYRRYAFTEKDNEQLLEIGREENGTIPLLVNGQIRTYVEGPILFSDGTSAKEGKSYELCYRRMKGLGSPVRLQARGKCRDVKFGSVAGNPPIDFPDVAPAKWFDITTYAEAIDQQYYRYETEGSGIQILNVTSAIPSEYCSYSFVPGLQEHYFAKFGVEWFISDPRVVLVNNDVDAPLEDGGHEMARATAGTKKKDWSVQCSNVARSSQNEKGCFWNDQACAVSGQKHQSAGALVCGSPNEVATATSGGGVNYDEQFNVFTKSDGTGDAQKELKQHIWTASVLSAKDQLRQRVAWALSQILVIGGTVLQPDHTEQHLAYYDIFVRHAFGSYRDVLKEVSMSPMMAKYLDFYQSKSTAYIWETEEELEHPDENYAREVMQLFSIGLYRLNKDGTVQRHPDGTLKLAYTNNDILEFARVWTGFTGQKLRGNIEEKGSLNGVDPMRLEAEWRDKFPKLGLNGHYIGHGLPLCADLPAKHFLRKGAAYRLMGRTSQSELQRDQEAEEWRDSEEAVHFVLNTTSELHAALCKSFEGNCTYPALVTLEDDLECTGLECDVDTVRTVGLEDGIFYEYARRPCIHLAFYNNAEMIKSRISRSKSPTYMCADPNVDDAQAACCKTRSPLKAWREQIYFGERVTFHTANERCSKDKFSMCQEADSMNVRDCDFEACRSGGYFWTDVVEGCNLKAKIQDDGRVAIVHHQSSRDSSSVSNLVSEETKSFFIVKWNNKDALRELLDSCGEDGSICTTTSDKSCLCPVEVTSKAAFETSSLLPTSVDEVVDLPFAAVDVPTFSMIQSGDVKVHSSGTVGPDTVFQVTDHVERTLYRKNLISTVSIPTTSLSFPNPVHIISLSEPNVRDALAETDEAIDQLFYSTNTAPFLAIRLAQRFGISNPSPRYVKKISKAFRKGIYEFGGETFGSGRYGDLGATVAAVLLDPESRDVLLEADPYAGSVREPLIKVLHVMRALDFKADDAAPYPILRKMASRIKQMAHALPNVFSFFKPEFEADGAIASSSLVSPEAAVHNTPEIINLCNGLISLLKFGLVACYENFGTTLAFHKSRCSSRKRGRFRYGNSGHLTYMPEGDADAVINKLATLMTSGRLSPHHRKILKDAYLSSGSAIKAQELIVTTAEFHTTGTTAKAGGDRAELDLPSTSARPYKATVFVMLAGGIDSFNMIVPHTCRNDLVRQYELQRGSIMLSREERRKHVIDVDGQPCTKFSVHPDFEFFAELYQEGELSFYLNTGVLDSNATTKENFKDITRTGLFAHNLMQHEAKRGDPFFEQPRTGYLGRLCDVLETKLGYQAGTLGINGGSVALRGNEASTRSPMVVSEKGVTDFDPSNGGIRRDAIALNGPNDVERSNVFGEWWSDRFDRALKEVDLLGNVLSSDTPLFNEVPAYKLSARFASLVKLMKTKDDRRTDRDVFAVTMGGFDTHSNMKVRTSALFKELDTSLKFLKEELVQQELWDKTTIVLVSDFGRTLTGNNNDGSDHAWGGHYAVMGGKVKGGQALGKYPEDLTASSPLNVGRGRFIPSTPWEGIWKPVAEWMAQDEGAGVNLLTERDLKNIMPKYDMFKSSLYSRADLFK